MKKVLLLILMILSLNICFAVDVTGNNKTLMNSYTMNQSSEPKSSNQLSSGNEDVQEETKNSKILTNENVDYILTPSNSTVIIKLASNPTTGYTWRAIHDKKTLTLKSHKFDAPKTQLVGAGGSEIWEFAVTSDALATQSATPLITQVTFFYVRPWEIKDNKIPKGTKTKVITIAIQP